MKCPGCLETPCPRCPEPRHNTCHHLRKRPARCGNAARRAVSFLSRRVSACAAVGHCVAIVTDIWRTASGQSKRSVEPLALPIRARFVPLHGPPDCSPDWCMPCIPAGSFSAVLLQLGRRAGRVRTCGRGRLPDRPAPSRRGCHGGGGRVPAARWDWIQQSRSCTCRGPVMHLSWTRRIAVPVCRDRIYLANPRSKLAMLGDFRLAGDSGCVRAALLAASRHVGGAGEPVSPVWQMPCPPRRVAGAE